MKRLSSKTQFCQPAGSPFPARRCRLAGCVAASIVVLILGANWQYRRHNFKRFGVVRQGVLYRSGQLSEHGLQNTVHRYGIRTVISLRREPARLSSSLLFDPFGANGEDEPEFVANRLDARFLHWPLGSEVYYPWPTPQVFEHLFKVVDDPGRCPVLVHCVAGKHRTGVFVALFRLEYDRWGIDRAMEELRSSGLDHPPRIPDHNLRTYVPRPRPTGREWDQMLSAFDGVVADDGRASYEKLTGRLRASRGRGSLPQIRSHFRAVFGASAD